MEAWDHLDRNPLEQVLLPLEDLEVQAQASVQLELVLEELQQDLVAQGPHLEALETPLELQEHHLVAQGTHLVTLEVLLAQLAQGQGLEVQDQHSDPPDLHLEVPPIPFQQVILIALLWSFISNIFLHSVSFSGFGQQPQQAQQPNQHEALYNALVNVNIFGDERDTTLTRWNQLQAVWGTGVGKCLK